MEGLPIAAQGMFYRRSLRMSGFDYSQPGTYFVTMCTFNRRCLFGSIVDYKMCLNECGKVVSGSWLWLSKQYGSFLCLDDWVVMPNHIHGLVSISVGQPLSKPLGRIICAFKNVTRSKLCAKGLIEPNEKLWQRGFYEHVVRNDLDLKRIRQYILDNPAQWHLDKENLLAGINDESLGVGEGGC